MRDGHYNLWSLREGSLKINAPLVESTGATIAPDDIVSIRLHVHVGHFVESIDHRLACTVPADTQNACTYNRNRFHISIFFVQVDLHS